VNLPVLVSELLQRPIGPATRFMDRLRFRHKLLSVAAVFMLPTLVAMYLLLRHEEADIAAVTLESRGADAIQPIDDLLAAAQEHRGRMVLLLAGDRSAGDGIEAANKRGDAAVAALDAWLVHEGSGLNLEEKWAGIKSAWIELKHPDAADNAAHNFATHGVLADRLIDFSNAVADASNLSLDPVMSTYSLINAITVQIPESAEALAQLRAFGAWKLEAGKTLNPVALTRLTVLEDAARNSFEPFSRSFEHAFVADADTATALVADLQATTEAHAAFLARINAEVVEANTSALSGPEFYEAGGFVSAHLHDLSSAAVPQLKRLLKYRLHVAERNRAIAIGACVCALIAAYFLYLGFVNSLSRALKNVQSATAQLARGEFPERIAMHSADEMRDIACELETVSRILKASTGDLRKTLALQTAILDGSALGIIATDQDGRIVCFNRAAQRMLGYSETDVVGRLTPDALHDRDELAAHAKRISEIVGWPVDVGFETLTAKAWSHVDGIDEREWTYVRKDGSRFPVLLSVTATRDSRGIITGFLGIAHDISERKQKNQTIERALREKETLLKEVYHRVKNNLQVITSLFDLQLRGLPDGPAQTVLRDGADRVRAMALVHEKLYQSGTLSSISLQTYVEELCERLGTAFYARERGIAFITEVEPIDVVMDTAIPLGLLINEVISNSLKHGFPDGRTGSIRVRLAREDFGRVTMSIADDGVGYTQETRPGESKSLGLKLIASLSEQLDGTVTVDSSNGVQLCMSFPLSSADGDSAFTSASAAARAAYAAARAA
jgi:PAS domain S-box-containing protein